MTIHQDNSSKRNPLSGLANGLTSLSQRLCVLACIIFYSLLFTLSSPALAADLITNTATANFSINGVNKQLSNSVQFTKDTVVTPTDAITLSKQADVSNVSTGDTVSFTLTITNPNNHIQNDLTVVDILPANLQFQTGSTTLNGANLNANQVSLAGLQLSLSLGNIPAKATWIVNYQVKVSGSGVAINKATATTDSATSTQAQASLNITLRTPATIKFLKINDSGTPAIIPPTAYNDDQNGGKHWQSVNTITLANGTTVNLPTPQPLIDAPHYSLSDPVVIEVTDLDQNTDPTVIETIIVEVIVPETGDKEVLLLQETSPNSGVFRGVLLTTTNSVNTQNGLLSLHNGHTIRVSYHDEFDNTDSQTTAALVVPNNIITLSKKADKTTAAIGELVRYTLKANNKTNFALPNVHLYDSLPLGFRYLPNTARLSSENGANLAVSVTSNGNQLDFTLDNNMPMPVGDVWTLQYLTNITAGVQTGEAINTAFITSNQIKSAKARASVTIHDDLMRTKSILTGRVYIGCAKDDKTKTLKNARIFTETGRSVLSDEQGFWHMEGMQAGTHVLRLDEISLPKGYQPIICRETTRHAKNAASQFVELQAGALWKVDFHVKKSAHVDDVNDDANTDDSDNSTNKNTKAALKSPFEQYGKDYLETAPSGFEILWPKNNHVPDVASTKIMVKSDPQYKVDVLLNGKKVSGLNYDGSQTNKSRTAVIRRWKGVDLNIKDRNNILLVILKDKSGKEVARKTHVIHFSGEAHSVEYLAEESTLVADGKTIPVIAIRPKDKEGFRLRTGSHGYFTLENTQFQVKTISETVDTLNLNEPISGAYKYHVEADGIARIALNPTTQSGKASLTFTFTEAKHKPLHVWLKPKLREWILVGLAEGTLAHNTLTGNMSSLTALDETEGYTKQGRIAFYAQGKVKGKYLLTVAYDTHKAKQKVGAQLNGNIDPDAWYTLYADNSNSQYNAPSAKKLYLKIEKDNFYTLFGDYNTQMNVTQLAHYNRTLNGIKSEYKGKQISYNAFISETFHKHHRDNIPGDGTSGLYQLKHDIAPNSETIKIEVRDRFHSEKIVDSRTLTRYQDYDIDYDAGTLFFKSPITGRDGQFNPKFIVVDYDSKTENSKEVVAGGRVAAKTHNEKLEVGLSTIIIQKESAKNDSLIALDANYKLTENTKLHVEIAQSKTEASLHQPVNAEIIELEKQIADMEAKIFYRKQGDKFGINSRISEGHTQKMGAELRYKINNKTSINAEVSRQKNLDNNNQRDLAEISIKQQRKQLEVTTGLRHSKETFADSNGVSSDSAENDTVLIGARYTTKSGKISYRASVEQNIGTASIEERSPNRKLLGMDVKINNGMSVFTEYEQTDNNSVTTENLRVGVTKSLWTGAKAKTSYTKERTDKGQRDYATLGLTQRIKVSKNLHADLSIDHAKTLSGTQKRFNDDEPLNQGSQRDDYTAFSVGMGSQFKDWSWSGRAELRDGELSDKINLQVGLIHKFKSDRQVSVKYRHTETKFANNNTLSSTKLSLGTAWHPTTKEFVYYSRLDLIDEHENTASNGVTNNGASNKSHTQKVVHNTHFNRTFYSKRNQKRTQMSLHHGIKHIINNNNAVKHATTIDTATV
ncbi:MAG: hypothetical protein V3U64_00900, partial [Cocleimonas sp.]